jgi:conjugal transfer pilus assembly protein TraW
MSNKNNGYYPPRPNVALIAALMMLSALMGTTISLVLTRVILPSSSIATVDMTGLMYRFVKSEASGSVSLTEKRVEVRAFSQQLETVLKVIAQEKHVILVPKEAVIAGSQDMTTEVAARLSLSRSSSVSLTEKPDESQCWQIQQQESVRVAADRPVPVEGLRSTIQARRWFWDPSIVIPYNVQSANGAIVVKAGTRFNPLEKNRLKNALTFFDGDDPEQVAWAQKQNQSLKGRVLLILVNGSLHEVQSYFPQKQVYFDQGGRLTQKLRITQIPAIVTQVGTQLEIKEVKP